MRSVVLPVILIIMHSHIHACDIFCFGKENNYFKNILYLFVLTQQVL